MFAVVLSLLIALAGAKSVGVSVAAPWTDVQESAVILETISNYNNSAFFPLLSLLINERMKGAEFNETEFLFNTAEKTRFLKPSTRTVAEAEAKVGTVIPRLERQFTAFSKLPAEFQNCPAVLWTEGELTCDRMALFSLQAPKTPKTPELFTTDRVIGSGDQWLILYADIDSPEFPEWHEILLETALMGRASYVLRLRPSTNAPSSEDPSPNEVAVAGYGVSFDVKKTDYLVVDADDVKVSGGSAELNPALGFALASHVRETGDYEKLKELVFNLPAHLQDFKDTADLSSTSLGLSGVNSAFLDGVILKDSSVFDFYSALQNELALVHALEAQTPEGTNIPEFLTSGLLYTGDDSHQAGKHRCDLSIVEDSIGYVNNIELDEMYSDLSPDLDLLKLTSSPFAPLRRNMHSVVVVGDLKNPQVLSALADVARQAGQYLPLQIGIVASNPEWLSISRLGQDARMSFLTQIVNGMSLLEAQQVASDHFEQEPALDVKRLDKPQKFYECFGEGPLVFVNGFALPVNDWMDAATKIFEADSEFLRNHENVDHLVSFRDTLFQMGKASRSEVLDPMSVEYRAWPLGSPMARFAPTGNQTVTRSVLLSSAFTEKRSIQLAEAVLKRAHEVGDVELVVRPLKGIDPRLYASMLDPVYSLFQYSLDLFAAARGHLFEFKSQPRVFEAAAEPPVDVSDLPDENESVIVDGRFIDIAVDPTELPALLELESDRVGRIAAKVPGIGGIGIAALSAAAEGRVATAGETPDASVPGQSVTLTLVIDPATTEGQEFLGLGVAAEKAGLTVNVFLAPSKLDAKPVRFYEPILDRKAHAEFELNDNTLYTARIVEPQGWVTVAEETPVDLDNVLLNQVEADSIDVKYKLKSLLLQGFLSGNRVGGTHLKLLSGDSVLASTRVMANLGYFQFEVPGPGNYQVCTEDRLFSTKTDCLQVEVSSFNGMTLQAALEASTPKNSKKSLWNSLKNTVSLPAKPADVNVFTIASGHLYERFAQIMMLSVVKNTKHSVKFWLIEDFASPDFKASVDLLAQENGFDYEFVSYKWPKWMRQQSEKQREIWGYKILFLDVLFPPELDNVIFVDSDQIVRTDLHDLLEYDLGDAPYAFAPMGESREETEPFRFWKTGYWKEVLKGNPYHISALFRVDLKKFREKYIGDVLRQQYQRFSSNPANLANLDQDLPNLLQPIIPIYTLPQEWLWCETWCDDQSLETARTIDLCNNPLTKEPKLERARRQTPEWAEYDAVVAAVAQRARGIGADHPNEHTFSEGGHKEL